MFEIKTGTQIKSIRISKNITLEKLSKLSGVSKSYLFQIEKNAHNPTINILNKISTALDIPVKILLDTNLENEVIQTISFFKKFDKLSDENKIKIKDIIDIWSE